jgi:hypothetical protein
MLSNLWKIAYNGNRLYVAHWSETRALRCSVCYQKNWSENRTCSKTGFVKKFGRKISSLARACPGRNKKEDEVVIRNNQLRRLSFSMARLIGDRWEWLLKTNAAVSQSNNKETASFSDIMITYCIGQVNDFVQDKWNGNHLPMSAIDDVQYKKIGWNESSNRLTRSNDSISRQIQRDSYIRQEYRTV